MRQRTPDQHAVELLARAHHRSTASSVSVPHRTPDGRDSVVVPGQIRAQTSASYADGEAYAGSHPDQAYPCARRDVLRRWNDSGSPRHGSSCQRTCSPDDQRQPDSPHCARHLPPHPRRTSRQAPRRPNDGLRRGCGKREPSPAAMPSPAERARDQPPRIGVSSSFSAQAAAHHVAYTRAAYGTRTPATERSASMMGSAFTLTAPVASRSSDQLNA